MPRLQLIQIQKPLGLEKHGLAFRLKRLFFADLVDRRLEAGAHKYSYHNVGPLGTQVLVNLANCEKKTESKDSKTSKL